ncbi:MAG: 4Fe-4S binding protein [Candidatus Hodarchaeota archaeon]
MVKITAIKEVVKALFNSVTTKYPFGPPTHVPERLRGLPQFDEDKCIGCGACYASCSAGAISMINGMDIRKLDIPHTRCIYCGRCEDICPEEAIKLSNIFELATVNKDLAVVSIELNMHKCQSCGGPITTLKQIDRIKERILEGIDPLIKEIAAQDLSKYMDLCVECRGKMSYALNTHTRKYYLREWAK